MANETLKDWILKQRIENYGYDYPFWRKLTAKKTQLKSQIKNMSDAELRRSLAKAGILGGGGRLGKEPVRKRVGNKWVKTGEKRWSYTTGQSFNEELLNIMQIGASRGKKSFWEVQEKWWN